MKESLSSHQGPAADVVSDDPTATVGPVPLELVAILERADEEDIEAYVAKLDEKQVVAALHLADTLGAALRQLGNMTRSRIDIESILVSGSLWTAPNGRQFMYAGDRSRVCKDVAGLKAAAGALITEKTSPLAKRAFREAFKEQPPKLYLTELDKFTQFLPEAEGTVRDFVTWTESKTKHLRPTDE